MRKLLVAAVLLLLWSLPAIAHHSFGAEFDANQPITLKGTLTKLEWVNPHGWLHIDVAQPDGKVVSWAVESVGGNALVRRGLRQTDFTIGTEVIVEGFRAKDGTPTASGTSVKLTDGRNFFVGSTDAGQPVQAPK